MTLLAYVNHLWKPLEPGEKEPAAEMIAQASGGVLNALHGFVWHAFSTDGECERLEELIERRRYNALGAELLTFKGEFLRLAQLTKEGFLVLTIACGGAVRSVDTCKEGEAPRALTQEEARELFEGGKMAVIIDKDGGKTVSVLVHPKHFPTSLSLCDQVPPPFKAPSPPPPPEPEPEPEALSADELKTRTLLLAARAALLPENWALRPASTA